MIVGLIIVGSVIGATSALAALILGHSIWIALLIYSALGALSVLAGAAALALRADPEEWAEPSSAAALIRTQRG
jgi:hypothetical protein